MRRVLLIALGVLAMPALAQAQVEIGLDGGLAVRSVKNTDKQISFDIPSADMRLGFASGESIIVETILGASYNKQGDNKFSWVNLTPGVNFLFSPSAYVRGEAGLMYYKTDNGTTSDSSTQFQLGGAVGTRKMMGEGTVLRLEAGVDRALEKKDAGVVTMPASWNFRVLVGISAVVGG